MKWQQVNRLAIIVISLVATVVVLSMIFVIGYVIYQGIGTISGEFLTVAPRNGMREGGIMPALVGTIGLTFGTAIAAAICPAEYAGDNRLSRWVRMAIVNLAGIPSRFGKDLMQELAKAYTIVLVTHFRDDSANVPGTDWMLLR